MMLAVGVLSRSKTSRWLIRLLVLALGVSVLGLAPVTKAAAAGVAAENFTMTGSWTCTSNCGLRGVWGIQGHATVCLESEAEVVTGFPTDVPVPLLCSGATFAGNVNSTCTGSVCAEVGGVNFYLPDASDPGYTIGPIPVGIVGTATPFAIADSSLGTYEEGYTLTAAFEGTYEFPWTGVVVWPATGELHGGACDGTVAGCSAGQSFTTSITGVEVDE
jgi:hypothetical protein